MGVEQFFMVKNLTRNTPSQDISNEERKAAINSDQIIWEQTSDHSIFTHHVQFLSTIPRSKSTETPHEKPSLRLRTRWSGTKSKRANVETTSNTTDSTAAEQPSGRVLQALPAEASRKKLPTHPPVKPQHNQQLPPSDNATIGSVISSTVNQTVSNLRIPIVQNSSTSLTNPTSEPERKINTPIPASVAPGTPTPGVKPIAIQKDKSVTPGVGAAAPPTSINGATPVAAPPKEIKPPTPSSPPPSSDAPTATSLAAAASTNSSAPSHRNVDSGQLTSIAIGVAVAASLFIFVVLVVIFKIRVSRKKALKRLTRFQGNEFFSSPNRQSLSGSNNSSRNSVFVVPRPIGNTFTSLPETKQEKSPSPFPASNFAGVGSQLPKTYQFDSQQNMAWNQYTPPTYPIPPARPPRSPLRSQTIQNSENYYHLSKAQNELRTQAINPSSSYLSNSNPHHHAHLQKGKEKSNDLQNPFNDYEYNDALEYLDQFHNEQEPYSNSNNYLVQLDRNDVNLKQYPPTQFTITNQMQLEDRPYDHRYTVDKNGVLSHLAPSIPPTSPGTDYYYKKRII